MSIEEGKGVVLKKGKNLKYVFVSDSKQEKMENFFFTCKDMIGKPFGTAFKVVDKKQLEVIDPTNVEEYMEEYENSDSISVEQTKDNRCIQDNPDSQKLSKDKIMLLREEKTGEEIVKELVENSSTFQSRTDFSQAKYLKKKKKKYIAQFVALRPSVRLLAEMYFFKNPTKILELRPDTLSQILTWSNVQSNSKVLLVENCQGFVAGAMLERLGLDGNVVQLYQGSYPVRIIMEQLNFSVDDVCTKLCSFPLEKIAALKHLFDSCEKDEELVEMILGKTKEESVNEENRDSPGQKSDLKEDEKVKNKIGRSFQRKNRKRKHRDENAESEVSRTTSRVAFISREERLNETLKAMKYLRSRDFTSLVIVSKYHPKSLLFALLDFVPSACAFVVYFTHQEPLMDCYVTLRERNMATNLELTESWLRNIQVLPKRSHPEIVMSSTGGYILRGIKVD